jgi:Ca-activated chloride channel homolog
MKTTLLLDHHTAAHASQPGAARTRLLLTLVGDAPPTDARPPIAVALVLDRSGSMDGEPLEAATEAAAWAVARLHPQDVISSVVFDDAVDVLAEPARAIEHAQLGARLRAVRSGGSTNLSGGWLRGRQQMERAVELLRGAAGATRRIVLLTDGHANQGITDVSQLTELARRARTQGISTTTIGVGAGYDDALLRAMADAGGGNAWYVERADQSHDVFAEELGNLLSVSAQGVSVSLRLAPSVHLLTVHSTWPAHTTSDGTIVFDLGDLYASDPKPLLLELVHDVANPLGGEAPEIARLTITADVIGSDGSVEHRVVHLPIAASAEQQGTLHPEIEQAVLLAASAKAREEAAMLQRSGDAERAADTMQRASRQLRERIEALPEAMQAELHEQVADLSVLAERYATLECSEQDAKYQMQRSYNARRGKRRYDATLARRESPEG